MPFSAPRRPISGIELTAVVAAVGLVLATAWHGFGVYFCIGSMCPGPSPEEIRTYRLLVAALAGVVTVTVVLALRRRGWWALVLHLGVAASGLVVAVLFAVPQIDWHALREPAAPEPDPHYVPCYSGSNHCVGG